MSRESRGICPNCQRNTGDVGQSCPAPECSRSGYVMIPMLSFDACKARAEKKGGRIEPWIGRRIDRYLLVGKAGEGGMGAVYIALQQPLNREVAVKIMPSMSQSKEALERFETEAKAVSALDHPNIVKLYDYGFGDLDGQSVPYMVLEYIKHGRTLKQLMVQEIEEHGQVRPDVMIQIFRQVLAGLGAAHAAGIVHRDVKPENIMLTQIHGNPYYVKILDFGLATGLQGNNTGLTGSNQILGTPTYMAPEQIPSSRRQEIDLRTDLYAVGVVLFEAMTGVRPFPGDTALAVLTAKANEKFNPFEAPQASKLTRTQRAFLEKAISFEPEGRFQNAADMLEALVETTVAASGRKRGGLLGLVEDALGKGGASASPDRTPSPTPAPAPVSQTPNPLSGMSRNPLSGMAQNPLSGMYQNPLSGAHPNPLATSGLHRRPRTTTNPVPAVTTPAPGWQTQTSELRRSGGAISTMTPEERAERLKKRKRRTTGANMAMAVDAAARAGSDTRPRARGVPAIVIAFAALLVVGGLFVGVPRFMEGRRVDRTRLELKELRSSLIFGGKFVGLDSVMLRPGTQLDYYIVDPNKEGESLKDPWGNPYRVKYSLQNPTGYILYSTGADGEKGSCDNSPGNDDICVELGMP